MTYFFNAWATHAEDPAGAAMRAERTAERHVSDAAHDYHSAVARGNAAEINATKAKFRQAWETDVRRKGGHPEEFIPDYANVNPVPGPPPYGFFFGQTKSTATADPRMPVVKLMSTMAILYILWMFLG